MNSFNLTQLWCGTFQSGQKKEPRCDTYKVHQHLNLALPAAQQPGTINSLSPKASDSAQTHIPTLCYLRDQDDEMEEEFSPRSTSDHPK